MLCLVEVVHRLLCGRLLYNQNALYLVNHCLGTVSQKCELPLFYYDLALNFLTLHVLRLFGWHLGDFSMVVLQDDFRLLND